MPNPVLAAFAPLLILGSTAVAAQDVDSLKTRGDPKNIDAPVQLGGRIAGVAAAGRDVWLTATRRGLAADLSAGLAANTASVLTCDAPGR